MAFPSPLPRVDIPRANANTIADSRGLNLRDFAQLLKDAVIIMKNYWKVGHGRIRKAPGTDVQYSITTGTDAGDAVSKLTEWFPGYDVISYGNVVKVRDTIADVTIDVKDDFSAEVTDGVPYGGYFYVADDNDGDSIGYLKATLDYKDQTVNYTVGLKLTGADSNAKAIILADSDSGATGTLTLKMLSGSFEDGEIITDNTGPPGSATVDGTLAVSWTEISDAPKCKKLAIINGNRLAAGNTINNVSEVHISRADQLLGVPFVDAADWTVGEEPESPFKHTFDEAREVTAFGKIGNQTVVLLDQGKFGFRITQIDVSGTGLVLDTPVDFQNIDFGASGRAVSTSQGIFYANEAGIFQMVSGGQTDVPFSAQDFKLSSQLDFKFTKDYDFAGADLIFDDENNLLLIAARDSASANNVVLVYKLDKSDKKLNGWSTWDKNVSVWMKKDNEIYFGNSTETTVSKLDYLLGDNDDEAMFTEIVFEFQTGALNELARAVEVAIGGELGAETEIEISLDTFDRKWIFSERVALNGNGNTSYTFSGNGISASLAALGSGGIGSAAMGGRGTEGSELNPAFGQRKMGTSDFLRARLRLSSFDKYQHEINFLTLTTEPRGTARTSNLTS